MNYRHVYMLIISHAKLEQSKGLRPLSIHRRKDFEQNYEFHHILPKGLFPLWKKQKSNIVPLTPREHFFCHQLLTKIYPCTETFTALWFMSNSGRWKCSSREYQRSKNLLVKSMLGHHRTLGYKRSPEYKRKISRARKRFLSTRGEWHYYTNREITIQAKVCPVGFRPGRTLKNRKEFVKKAKASHIGMHWWTNGTQNIHSKACPGPDFRIGRIQNFREEAITSIKQKLRKLNKEKPMAWYNDGIRNYRIRKGDAIPSNLVKGKLSKKKF